jgi:hypothetical protein
MGQRVENLAEWGRHIIENLRNQALRSPDARLDAFIAEFEGYVPAFDTGRITSGSPCRCGWPATRASYASSPP